MKTEINENELAAYAESVENKLVQEISMPEQPVKHEEPKIMQDNVVIQQVQMPKSTAELHAEREDEIRRESIAKGIGKAIVPVDSLPSKGLFYPVGTKIWINSASLGDIRRWSAMNEGDINDITEKMQNILESCCSINFGPDTPKRARWKDLLDLDRLYLLFAIHDFTFPEGKNDVKIKLNEKDDITMRKENIKFIEFPEKLMKFYNEKKRCFSFPVENKVLFKDTDGMMDIYMPTIGVSDWLKDYLFEASRRQDSIDEDFISYASLLIPDWRELSGPDYYYELIDKTTDWGTYEWSLISKVKDIIVNAASAPTMQYIDKGGVEREAPLNFRDGLKSLFQVKLHIDL